MSAVLSETLDSRESLLEKAQALANSLEREADRRVTGKRLIEERWIEDIHQYQGVYTEEEMSAIRSSKHKRKSQVYINRTRPKVNVLSARLFDILFPTDDKNFSVQATPVPDLNFGTEQASSLARENRGTIEGDQAATIAAHLGMIQDEAKAKASAMDDEITDQLRECDYNQECRRVIQDACKLGTGVMKGPVVSQKPKRRWSRATDPASGLEVHALEEIWEAKPTFYRVDPWSFFPDMDARDVQESESFFERHLMTRSDLKELARQPGFNESAIRKLLKSKPRGVAPQYINDLKSISDVNQGVSFDKYVVWEYHGPLDSDDLRCMKLLHSEEDYDEEDMLENIHVHIWFAQGEILKFGIHPLDVNSPLYSVFVFAEDDASIFGFGVPSLVRDPQKILCAAWRMMMDNSAYCSAPQIVYSKDQIEPENGIWEIDGGKIWQRRIGGAIQGQPAFETYNFDMHQTQLANIISMAADAIDIQSGIPLLAQGEPGVTPGQTAFATSILHNSMNVTFRAIVKAFDDQITIPNIQRIYHWNMQFSDKEHIKGDFQVDARGSSVLLLRELQSTNLMAIALQLTAHPILGPDIKALPVLRRLVQSLMLPADELVKTDAEKDEEMAQAAELPPEPNPAMEKIAAELNMFDMKLEHEKEMELMRRETALMVAAHQGNIKLDDSEARREIARMKNDSAERKVAAEAAMTSRVGPSGGGLF